MTAPGLFTRTTIARGRLERAIDAHHSAAYLAAIGHVQAPDAAELEGWTRELELAYADYLASVNQVLESPPGQA